VTTTEMDIPKVTSRTTLTLFTGQTVPVKTEIVAMHQPHGPSAFLAMGPEQQAAIVALLDVGKMVYAAETLFLPFPLTPRRVPDGDVWQYNHPEFGTLDVTFPDPADAVAHKDANVEVRGLGYFCHQPLSDPDGTRSLAIFTVRRADVFGGPFTADRGLLIS
jgi:hypothetical protein